MDINKTPNLFVGNVFMHILVLQKEHCCSFLLSYVALCCMSERWKPSMAVMHQSTFTLREDLEARGGLMVVTSGGDTLSFCFMSGLPSWRMLTCVSITGHSRRHRHPFGFWNYTDRTKHTKLAFLLSFLVVKTSESNEWLVGWLVGWIERGSQLSDTLDGRELKEC